MSYYGTSSQFFEERPSSFAWASLRREFTFSPLRLKTALKMAVGGTLGLFLACAFNWKFAPLAMVTALFFNRPDTRYDLHQALGAATATVVLSTFYCHALNWSQNPLLFGLLVGGALVFYGSLTTLPVYGPCFTIAQVVSPSTLVVYFYQPNPRQDVFMSLTVVATLGYVVMFAVNYLLWPYSPREAFDERLRFAWEEYRDQFACWKNRPNNEAPLRRPDTLDLRIVELLVASAALTTTDPADEGPRLRTAAVGHLQELVMLLQNLRRGGGHAILAPAGRVFDRFAEAADRRCALLARVLAGRIDGLPGPGDAALSEAVQTLCEKISESTPAGWMIESHLRRLCLVLDTCGDTFRAVARLPMAERITGRDQRLVWTPPFHWKLFSQLGPASIRQGAKVALVVLGCMAFWQAFRWPNGGSILIGGLTVTLPTAGLSLRQSILRVWGLVLGLMVSYLCTVLVVTCVETFVGYGLCVFCVLVLLGYLSGASSRVAYLGFQAAITFVFVFVSDDLQSIDLEPLRARFVALVAGLVIASVIVHHLWPVRRVNALFDCLARNFAACARLWTVVAQSTHRDLTSESAAVAEQFNRGLVEGAQLTSVIEYEGGEGGVRFGYATRLLTREIALFEQLRLLGLERPRPGGDPWMDRRDGERISAQFSRLCNHFDQDGELHPEPPPTDPTTGDPEPAEDHRTAEIGRILLSLERLTAVSVEAIKHSLRNA